MNLIQKKIINRSLYYTYIIFISLSIILPFGKVGNFSIFQIAFLLNFFLLIIYFATCNPKLSKLQVGKFLYYILFSSLFLCIWFVVGILNDNVLSVNISQLKTFTITFSVVYITYLLLLSKVIEFRQFFYIIIYSTLFYCLVKFVLCYLMLIGVIDYNLLIKYLQSQDINLVSAPILDGIPRFQILNDNVIPFSTFIVLNINFFMIRINKYIKFLFLFASISALYIAFSRYLWFLQIFVFILSYIQGFKLSKRGLLPKLKRLSVKKSYFYLPFILVFFLYILINPISQEWLTSVFIERFLGDNTQLSDSIREGQYIALIKEIWVSPFMGKGFGGFVPNLIRDELNPYSYELQWLSFLMQFGFIGIFILLLHIFSILFFKFPQEKTSNFSINHEFRNASVSLILLYIAWLSSGFTNPLLLSSVSGIIFSFFLVSFLINNSYKI